MPTVAIIPVKSFRKGMHRLDRALDPETRQLLGRALAGHVAETVEKAGMLPLVVTGEGEVAAWATSFGFPSLPDPGEGLDSAAAAGVQWATHSRSRWIVFHADLPLLQVEEVAELLDLEPGGDVIAPSADGGTSAIGSRQPIGFAFGPGSFHRHLPRLTMPGIVTTTGLLHDVDTPEDLTSVIHHPRGRWLEEVLR